jgi:hypothetical protein
LSAPSPGAQAIAALEIEDVFLISSKADVNRDFNQTERSHDFLQALQRYRIEEKVFVQGRASIKAPDEPFTVLRYFALAEVHIAKPGTKFTSTSVQEEIPADERLASLEFVFAVDYKCTQKELPSPEMLGAFSKNVAFHMWPYWREAVHAECARMRIPPVTIPMMKQGQVPPGSKVDRGASAKLQDSKRAIDD